MDTHLDLEGKVAQAFSHSDSLEPESQPAGLLATYLSSLYWNQAIGDLQRHSCQRLISSAYISNYRMAWMAIE